MITASRIRGLGRVDRPVIVDGRVASVKVVEIAGGTGAAMVRRPWVSYPLAQALTCSMARMIQG